MTQEVRYGIIGCGMMGQEHLRNIALLPGASVTAIYEPDGQMAQEALALCPGAWMAPSVADLLGFEGLDALVIVSPNHCHISQLEGISQRRPLPVLVEKPLFTDPADAARVGELTSYPAPIWVAMEYRYMPPVAKLIDTLDLAGDIKILTVREHRFPFLPKVGNWNRFNRKTGGTLVEKCCHFFDLMRLITRAEPVRIMASAGQEVNHLDEVYGGQVPDIWDTGYVIVDFDSGARAMLELCMYAEGARYQEEITAVGPKARVEALVPGPGRFWPEHLGAAPVAQVIVSPRDPKGPQTLEIPVDPALLAAGDHNGATFYQHQRFNAVVRGEAKVEVTLNDGLMAVRMGQAAQESARTGQAVTL